jgi:hypothetical protein
MKFLLTVFICSVTGGDCYTNPSYPKTFDNHYECMRAGLVDAYEILIADGNFTEEQINNLQLYPKFVCAPIKDEGKITT